MSESPSRRIRALALVLPAFSLLLLVTAAAQEAGGELPALEWSGRLRFGLGYYLDGDMEILPELRLGLHRRGPGAELQVALRLGPEIPAEVFGDLVDQASLGLRWDRLILEAGCLKSEWGQGDRLHVLDLLNPVDLTRSILPGYDERRIGELMVRGGYYAGATGLLEAVYMPVFTPDRVPLAGRWVAPELRGAGAAGAAPGPAAGPETGQAGIRYSDRVGDFEFAGLFYYGYLREPGWLPGEPALLWDRVLAFGVEGAAPLGRLGLSWEAGFFKTPDGRGDDPRVRNSRIAVLAGVERTLSLRRIEVDRDLQLSLRAAGTIVLSAGRLQADDVDRPAAGGPHRAVLEARVASDRPRSPFHPELRAVLHPLGGDSLLQPGLTIRLRDEVQAAVRVSLFAGRAETELGAFAGNDLVELSLSCRF